MSPECERVMDALGGPLPPELAAHAASCPDCRALTAGFGALEALPVAAPPAPAVSAPKLEAARTQALQELAAKPLPTPWWRELLVLLAVYAVVMVGGVFGLGRVGLVANMAPPMVVAGIALLLLALVGGGAFIAVSPSGRRTPWLFIGAVAVAVAIVQIVGGSGQPGLRGFLAGVIGCMKTEVLLSVPPLLITLVLLCRTAFQPVRAVAAGLSAAGVSLFVLHLHCSDGTASHLALGHVLPWLVLAGVALLLRAWLPTRSYAP
ncbi:NrsF family protein [Hyalangium rubrum]|uniref:NrsF family protein n=1 Tax=Hyalangium rubrum TaxID=3103134 RepID=A0ABU5HHK7_9BACT|nr:NrsF family protein [Hyalangium sp. s54d21]MDY7232627.1 NrsF family protein [Hyalangium sp. s54d21]